MTASGDATPPTDQGGGASSSPPSPPRGPGASGAAEPKHRLTPRRLGVGLGCLASVAAAIGLVLLAGSLTLNGCDFDLDFGPRGSRTGTETERLTVSVSPTGDLVDGQAVRVSTAALRGSDIVGIAQCLREADAKRAGFDACDQNTVVRFANREPTFEATFTIRQVLTVQGTPYDCAAKPGRCLVVAADAADYDRSGGRPLTFPPHPVALVAAPDRPKSAHLPVSGTPTGPMPADTRVRLTASGFQPGEPLLYARCTDELDALGPVEACEPLDLNAAMSAIVINTLPKGAPTAAPDGSATATLGVVARLHPEGDIFRGDTRSTIDCAERAGRCSLVIAAAADPHRSAVLPYELLPG